MLHSTLRKNIVTVFLLMLCVVWFAVGDTEKVSPPIREYTVTPTEDIVLYGYDIKKLVTMTFLEIEEEWGTVTKIDSEVGVVFNDNHTSHVNKKAKTDIDDLVSAEYFPIEDISIYDTYNEKYYSMIPIVIRIHGYLSFKEDSLTKEAILKELRNIMPRTDEAKRIIQTIRRSFILEKYNEDITITVNFNIANFKISYFIIWMTRGQIHYKYLFSTVDPPYP